MRKRSVFDASRRKGSISPDEVRSKLSPLRDDDDDDVVDDDDNVVFWVSQTDGLQEPLGAEKKVKGRTGWPQQVWALELNQ